MESRHYIHVPVVVPIRPRCHKGQEGTDAHRRRRLFLPLLFGWAQAFRVWTKVKLDAASSYLVVHVRVCCGAEPMSAVDSTALTLSLSHEGRAEETPKFDAFRSSAPTQSFQTNPS